MTPEQFDVVTPQKQNEAIETIAKDSPNPAYLKLTLASFTEWTRIKEAARKLKERLEVKES